MDRFDEMQTFVRVVEHGGISAAAERLSVAKSAVSRRLQELENRLGVELLRRTTRRVGLTEAGRVFYERCLRILEEVDEAENSLRDEQRQVQGLIRLAAPHSFTLYHVAPLLLEFMAGYPGVRLDLDLDDREIDIHKEGVDLTLRLGHLQDSSLIAKRLAPIRTVVCASPDYLAKHGEPLHPEALADHEWLSYSNISEQRQWSFMAADGTEHIGHPLVRMRANSGEMLLQAALAGQGIVLMPGFLCYRELAAGSLQQVLRDYRTEESAAYALYPSRRHLPLRVRLLIDFLAEKLGDEPPWENA